MRPAWFLVICLIGHCNANLRALQSSDKKEPASSKPQISEFAEGHLRLSILSSTLNPYGGYSYIAEELEATPEQKQELQEVLGEFNTFAKIASSKFNQTALDFKNKQDSKEFESAKSEYNSSMAGIVKSAEDKVGEILLPHQMTRLKQVSKQINICNLNQVSGIFVLVPLVEGLDDIDEAAKGEFLAETKKAMSEFEEEVKLLRKKYEERVWKSLPDSVRERLREEVGDIVYDKAR